MSEFKKLHEEAEPLLIANVWDVGSAKAAEKMNFKAIGTSSAAIAGMLGYEDGEDMSFSELGYVVERIISNINIPLSVDLESGFGETADIIAQNIKHLVNLGVVGINIEDSVVNGQREILEAENFSVKLAEVKKILKKAGVEIFLNVRTDTFLLGLPNAVAETKRRIDLYEKAGVDGVFIPCVVDAQDIENLTKYTNLPVNVMCMPELPDFSRLMALGVKRISMGNFLFDALQKNYEPMLEQILMERNFRSVFD